MSIFEQILLNFVEGASLAFLQALTATLAKKFGAPAQVPPPAA